MNTRKLLLIAAGVAAMMMSSAGLHALDEGLETPTVKPKALFTPPPEYPAELRKREVQGMVVVVALVDEQGRVAEVEVKKSSDPELARSALAAVRKWKYKPAEKDGQPIRATVTVPLQFALSE